jgi:quinol monooxygenase YgiN
MTIALVVRFDLPDEESARQFDQLTAEAVAQITAKEPGTLMYVTHILRDEPLSRVFYEVYADEAAFQQHEQAPHIEDFHARKDPLLVGQPRVELLTPGFQKGLGSSPR